VARFFTWLSLALGLLWAAQALAAPTFPTYSPDGVVDAASVLSAATRTELRAELAELRQTTGRELMVVTLPSLQGLSIEDYGYQLGRAWGVGDADRDDGVLLIIAPNERKVRIEVGYGLEPILTDALASTIIQSAILPKLRKRDFDGGALAGALAIDQQLRLPDDQARAVVEQKAASARTDSNKTLIKLVIGLVLALVIGLAQWLREGFFGLRPRAIYRSDTGGGLVSWMPNDRNEDGSVRYGGGSSGGSWGGGGGGSFGGGGSSGSW